MSEDKDYFGGLSPKDERAYWRRGCMFGVLVTFTMFLLAAVGWHFYFQFTIKPLPLCEKYSGFMISDPSGKPHVAMDMENVKKLAAMIRGIQEGTCRVAQPQEKTESM